MRDDYYYSGLYAEEQAEAEAQAKEAAHRQGPWHVSEYTDGRDALVYDNDMVMEAAMQRQMEGAQQTYEAMCEEIVQLTAQRDQAVQMLADWCDAVRDNGSGWDDWDEYYKDAAWRPCLIRELIDAARTPEAV